MQTKDVFLRSGVVKDTTELEAQPRWTDSNRIRFVHGAAHPIGGWEEYISGLRFVGSCRGMIAWIGADSFARLALGTNQHLYSLSGGTLSNITPLMSSGTLGADPFTTVNGQKNITVGHVNHGLEEGQGVTFNGALTFNGVTIDGLYYVKEIVDPDIYIIEHTIAATASGVGGGASVAYEYDIIFGRDTAAQGRGYGVGGYGEGTWGTPRESFIVLQPRVWTLDQWGQFLVACPRDGSIYEWQNSPATRAQILANAPTPNTAIFVTEEKHLVALNAGGAKMRVEWCDQDDNTVWAPSDITTAGGRTLVGGDELLFGMRTRFGNVIFSDAALFSMTFIGGLDVFGFDTIASGAAGIYGPRCAVEVGGTVYWMGQDDYYMYDGSVRSIPNSADIRRFVYDNINDQQRGKFFAVANTRFKEMFFFYVANGSEEINRYAKFNWEERAWDIGEMDRTAMIDIGTFRSPLGCTADGRIAEHEVGWNDFGSPMNEYIVSSPLPQASEGHYITEVLSIFPDFTTPGALNVSLLTREYSQSPEIEVNYGVITATTEKLDKKADGRIIRLKLWTDAVKEDEWHAGRFKFLLHAGANR